MMLRRGDVIIGSAGFAQMVLDLNLALNLLPGPLDIFPLRKKVAYSPPMPAARMIGHHFSISGDPRS
jgi:hypothetical protein